MARRYNVKLIIEAPEVTGTFDSYEVFSGVVELSTAERIFTKAMRLLDHDEALDELVRKSHHANA